MEFTRAAQVVAGILLHSSIMTSRLLDVRHMVLLHLPLEDAHMCSIGFRSGDITWPLHHLHLQLHQQGSCHLGGVFGVIIMLENCRSAQFLKGGHHLLLQNVTVYVGIHVSLNEPQLPSTAALMQPQTMMLPPPCLTVGKAQFLGTPHQASPHMLDTIWVKQVYLRLIRPQDMVPVIHALGQVVSANCLQAFLWASFRRGFLLGRRPCKPTCCSVWRMVWALTSWPSTSAT